MGQTETFDSWAIVELLGRVRMAGRLTEEERFGGKLGRLDMPIPDGDGWATTYFSAGSVYRITPTTEEVARSVAARNRPEPVHRWELPRPGEATDVLDGTSDDCGGRDRYDDDEYEDI